MLLLGLTGDIACGKSTVARLLVERGASHIDADALVHELYADRTFARDLRNHLQNTALLNENEHRAIEHRVLDIADESGAIDRKALGKLVFADATLLQRLEEFVHPAVAKLRNEKLAQLKTSKKPPSVVVLEAVKLVESGQARACDAVWWLTASRETQMHRLTQERGLSEALAIERLENQPSRDAKIALLDSGGVRWQFFSNDGSFLQLSDAVAQAWRNLSFQPDVR